MSTIARRRRCGKPSLVTLAVMALIGVSPGDIHAQGGVASPFGLERLSGVYDWGSRGYDEEFTHHFEFVNTCDRPVAVTLDTRDVTFLAVMPRVDAAPGTTKIPITLKTPGWPDRPECRDLKGALVVESSGYETQDGICRPSHSTYRVMAHVHWWDRPAPPPKLEVAAASDCVVWWNTGQRPPNNPASTEETCVDAIRKLAAAYREWVMAAARGRPPADWAWLPSAPQIASMNVKELLQMKQRADAQLGLRPSGA